MTITYHDKNDLLYIRFDETPQSVRNERINEDIILDIGDKEKIVGIEILSASEHIDLKSLLPITYEPAKASM
jgi:uncharacterized protein YuzE